MKKNLQKMKQYALVILLVLLGNYGWGQTTLYEHSFGTTTITGKPYNVSPVTFNSNLSNSSWTTSMSGFTSSGGSSGQALSLSNSSGTPTYTLTFNVATGFKLSITQFNFWRQRSSTGAPNWSLSINNINIGSGTTPTSGAAIGNTNVANSVSEITGTVTVVLTLSGASGTGTFRLDDFKLIGTVESLGSNTISTGTLTGAPFCVDVSNGAAGTLAYTSTGTYNGTFTAQLSDANGSFDSPVDIGTGTSPIAVNIPAGTALGSGYRVRVVNNDPATVGTSSTAFSVINTPPTIITPTSTSITASSAVLGGNVTVVGCNTITERGIYYSITNGFADGAGTKVSETSGSYSTGTFTVNVTGLTSGTTYYYKAFATSASGTSYTTQGTFSTLKIEPANHPTNFVASSVSTGVIEPQWTASVAGSQAPDGYLIKASTTTVVDPVDGIDPANSLNISSGSANGKVTPGSATTASTFTGMTSGTMYNYKIYPYTNTGISIDFKITDAPSFSHATLPTAPTALVASSVQETSATLTWTPGTFNAGNDFLVFVKSSSAITSGSPTFAPLNYTANPIFGQGTVYQNDVNAFCVYKGDATTVNISGLNPNETYHVAVYKVVEASNSDGTNSYSTVLIGNFLTLTNPVTVPYTQDFENATSEWVLNSLGTNKWSIGSATQNGGSKALYISNDGGVSNAYTLNSTQDTYASIRADLSGLTNATLTFDWKSNGELFSGTIYDYGEVYINTGGSDELISGAKEFYNTTTFAQKSIDISAYTGSIVTLKFRWVNDNADGNQPPFAVDNLSIVPSGIPNFTTTAITNITYNSANTGGTITTDGGSAITARGVVYATSPNPTIANSVVSNGSGNGAYTANLTGLLSNTTYYVRAYVTNANGTYYANEVSFTATNIAAPLALNATGVGATSFTATWDAVPGATGYEIDVYAIEAGANATDLFISEYVEGSSNNKAIEIFNGTGSTVNLADYVLIQFSNGASRTSGTRAAFGLLGNLNNGEVYVVSNSSSNSAISSVSDIQSGGLNFNGDDAFALYNSSDVSGTTINVSAVEIDIFGVIGSDPGTQWTGDGVYSTLDKTLVRKSSILSGVSVNPTGTGSSAFTTLTAEWDLYDQDIVSNLGSHTFDGGSSISYILQNQNIGNVTTYDVTGLDQNTTYYYVVRALDATSESVNSNEITTITAIVSTTWNGTTWSNGAPTSTIDAIIDGDFSTAGDFICKDLTVNAGDTLTINAADKLSVMEDLVNEGSIVFKSNATSTGRFDSYNGAAIAGSGTVTMERYIDGKRAYRLLSPGVSTAGTIADNWQEQVFITGSTTGANGFDTTVTGAPSMFTYENTGWAPISNTDALSLDAAKGYRILIRGDRTDSILTSPSNGTMNTPVTLLATGTMVTGDVTFNTLASLDYTLVANPYISPIDWATVTKTGVSDTYYAWDPNLGTGNQRGRYVSCDISGQPSVISDNGNPNTDVDQYIQPGQAFFIKKAISGTPGSITVKETDKAAIFTDVFRTSTPASINNTIQGKLGVNLYESLAYSLGEYPIDGAVAVSGTAFNTTSANDDTKKIMSHGEQVAFVRENIQLGVEKINTPQTSDELSIASVNLVPNKAYVWSMVLQDNFSNEDTYLYDAFTQIYHPLTDSSTTVVPFETTSDVNSTFINRFKVVFQTSALSTPKFSNGIVLYPNPAKEGDGFYLKGIAENTTVQLYTLLGKRIPVATSTYGTMLHIQPMSQVGQGIYIVNVTNEGTTTQVKWIVE